MISGGVHNYQSYPITVRRDDGFDQIVYLVAGGSGALLHTTHTIGKTRMVPEHSFSCYPLRGDSLALFSRIYGRRFRRLGLRGLFTLDYPQAAAAISKRLQTTERQHSERTSPSIRARIIASILGVPGPAKGGPATAWLRLPVRKLHERMFSGQAQNSQRPPFFKSFLRIDVTPGLLRISLFGASGIRADEITPPRLAEFTVPLEDR